MEEEGVTDANAAVRTPSSCCKIKNWSLRIKGAA